MSSSFTRNESVFWLATIFLTIIPAAFHELHDYCFDFSSLFPLSLVHVEPMGWSTMYYARSFQKLCTPLSTIAVSIICLPKYVQKGTSPLPRNDWLIMMDYTRQITLTCFIFNFGARTPQQQAVDWALKASASMIMRLFWVLKKSRVARKVVADIRGHCETCNMVSFPKRLAASRAVRSTVTRFFV